MFGATDIDDPDWDALMRDPSRPIFRKDRHLSSALTTSEIEYMFANRENPAGLKREHRELIAALRSKRVEPLPSDQFIPWLMQNWRELASTHLSLASLTTAIKVAYHATRISVKDYTGDEAHLSCPLTREIVDIYNVKRNFDLVISKITYSLEFHQLYTLGKHHGDVYGNLHLFWISPEKCFLITHSHFVCARDIINSWFSVLTYGNVHSTKYPMYNLYEEILTVIQAGCTLVSQFGMETYRLLKAWPSLVIASILRDTEGKRTLYNTLSQELTAFQMTDFYRLLVKPFRDDIEIQMRLELTGLWKCFGHPDIDMSSSVNNWIKKRAAGKEPFQDMAELLVWAFRLEFCRQYYKQRKRWPILYVETETPTKIKRNYANNTWDETSSRPWVPEDFQHVHFKKNLDFDYHVDASDLISDKSIIPCRAQWIHEFDKQAYRTMYGFFPSGPPPTSKSAVVNYLQQESVSIKETIDQLESGVIPSEWLVMVAVPKEREFKRSDARFYGKMTPEMRLYQTVTEKKHSKSCFRFIKNQSMTMSEEQLTRTILRMNTPVVHIEGETYVFIVLDFSSWCTNFRHELVTPLFTELDRLFGLHNVYSFTQLFPMLSHLLFQDRFAPPRQGKDGLPTQGLRCFPYPEAWLEGLRQKGWTLATIIIILVVSWRCGSSASLLGPGDNQVILLRIPPPAYLETKGMTRDNYVDDYLRILKDLCERARIVVKLEETWYSRDLFEYSRKYHYKGTQVSCCVKKLARLACEANQAMPTLTGDIAGIFSTGATAAAENSTPMQVYFCTIIEAYLHLAHNCQWVEKEPWEYMCCLLMTSRTLGGYPIAIYSQFCTRAVQDMLSTNLHLVRTIARDSIFGPFIGRAVTLETGSHKDFLSLVKDPQSIPLDLPIQPENFIKREVKKGLDDFIINKDVRALFTGPSDVAQQALVQDLASIKPCNPRLLNKLYSLSNMGLQERWSGMFSNTRSMQQTAFRTSGWSSELDVLNTVRNLELQFARYLRDKPSSSSIDDIRNTSCITTYTQLLRERAWGLEMEGITMPPQQEQTTVVSWESLSQNNIPKAILIAEQEVSCLHKPTSRGKHTPYFGSLTRLRAKRAPLQVVEVGSMIASLKQLMELHGWIKENEPLTSFVEKLISEKTTLSISELQKYTAKVYSGTISHRLPCPAMRRGGMANQNLNHSTFNSIVSDTALEYAKSGENYTICFQSCFLYALSVLAHYTDMGRVHPKKMALLFTCPNCTWRIPPETFTLETTVYPGIQLPRRIEALHHKDVYTRYPLHVQIDETISYSVQMARKFAAWIVNRKMIDKITALENRAMEESVTVSFVNLPEFSRLQLPLFLSSFIFYCAVYDHLFLQRKLDYYNEILEGITKNPYDVLIEGLRRCGHLRALCALQSTTTRLHFTNADLRILLYNILTKLCDDMQSVIATSYIVTPEDHLTTVIQPVKVWLYINKIQDSLFVHMTEEEFQETLRTKYSDYPAILPVCTLTEEETTFLIRAMKPQTYEPDAVVRNLSVLEEPTTSPVGIISHVSYMHWVMEEDHMLSSLRELTRYTRFRLAVSGRRLVTLEDHEGLYYAILQHSGVLDSGYPHSSKTKEWERDPYAIDCDRCPIPWSKEAYLCNGPKLTIDLPPNCLLLIPEYTSILWTPRDDIMFLTLAKSEHRPHGEIYFCRAGMGDSTYWVLSSTLERTYYPMVRVSDVSLVNVMTSLSYLRNDLILYLNEDICLSPYSSVAQCIGCLPKTPTDLVLTLKSRIRTMLATWEQLTRGKPVTYEGILERSRQLQRRKVKLTQIFMYHIIYNIVHKKPWHATQVVGTYTYYMQKREGRFSIKWGEHSGKTHVLSGEDLPDSFSLITWIRYCWALYAVDTAAPPGIRAPDVVFE